MDIHVHIHDGTVKEGRAPRRRSSPKSGSKSARSSSGKRKGKPMTRKTQLAINKGRRAKGMKPIKWKKKGV